MLHLMCCNQVLFMKQRVEEFHFRLRFNIKLLIKKTLAIFRKFTALYGTITSKNRSLIFNLINVIFSKIFIKEMKFNSLQFKTENCRYINKLWVKSIKYCYYIRKLCSHISLNILLRLILQICINIYYKFSFKYILNH